MKMWLIVYPDGTIMTWVAHKPNSRNHQKGAELYELDRADEVSVKMIADWIGSNYVAVNWATKIKNW